MLSALFCIHEFIDAQDWLVSFWLTGRWTILMSWHDCGIVRIQTPVLWTTGWTLICCATYKQPYFIFIVSTWQWTAVNIIWAIEYGCEVKPWTMKRKPKLRRGRNAKTGCCRGWTFTSPSEPLLSWKARASSVDSTSTLIYTHRQRETVQPAMKRQTEKKKPLCS